MQNVVITGATGGAGQMACLAASARGIKVTAIARKINALERLASPLVRTWPADLMACPIEALIAVMRGHDAVWNCVGLVANDQARQAMQYANVSLAERLFIAAAKARVPVFVHISSPAIYFNYSVNIDIPESYDPGVYASEYARSKRRGEHALQKLANEFPDTKLVILRPKALYGPFDRIFLPNIINTIKQCNGTIYLPSGGDVVIDLCYQGNLVHAMWLASITPSLNSGSVFNVTDNDSVCISEIIKKISEFTETPIKIKSAPYFLLKHALRLAHAFNKKTEIEHQFLGSLAFDTTLSLQEANRQLGYEPPFTLDHAIKLTLHSLKV